MRQPSHVYDISFKFDQTGEEGVETLRFRFSFFVDRVTNAA